MFLYQNVVLRGAKEKEGRKKKKRCVASFCYHFRDPGSETLGPNENGNACQGSAPVLDIFIEYVIIPS